MLLKIKRYLSAYNEYCEVSVEGAYINIKLIIGNRESGTGNWFLVPYLSKRSRFLFNYNWVYTRFCYCKLHQHVRH